MLGLHLKNRRSHTLYSEGTVMVLSDVFKNRLKLQVIWQATVKTVMLRFSLWLMLSYSYILLLP